MGEFIPDYLLREQAAVGALVMFGVLRVIGAAVAYERGWRIAAIENGLSSPPSCIVSLSFSICSCMSTAPMRQQPNSKAK